MVEDDIKIQKIPEKPGSESIGTDRKEDFPRVNRIMVCGNKSNGVITLAEKCEEFLVKHGIPDSSVAVSQGVQRFEDTFFGILPPHIKSFFFDSNAPKQSKPEHKKNLRSLIGLKPKKIPMSIETENVQEKTTEPKATLPRVVFALPEMRDYDSQIGAGMTVYTPYKQMQELCEKHKVPLIALSGVSDSDHDTELLKVFPTSIVDALNTNAS